MAKNPQLDESFRNATRWRKEAARLRKILLECGLDEQLKWAKPCYAHDGSNICIIQRMNDFLALMFFKGALLADPDGVLEVQGPNSRAGYRIRFTSVRQVEDRAGSIRACVREAIAVEKSGRKLAAADDLEYPQELRDRLDDDTDLGEAFARLTPGRQRGYTLYVASARHAKTRQARIDRYRDRILAGKGLHDR